MKKTTRYIVLALLCLNFKAKANDLPATSESLNIGDKMPASFWQQTHSSFENGKQTIISFQQFKGKAMLLDFWATWCGACLKGFPKMNAIQNQHSKYLKVLMVNTNAQDTQMVLTNFYKKQQEAVAGFSLNLIQNDQNLRDIFPIKSMPHYIWIGADGRIKAITTQEEVSETNIKRFIAGLTINLKVKEN